MFVLGKEGILYHKILFWERKVYCTIKFRAFIDVFSDYCTVTVTYLKYRYHQLQADRLSWNLETVNYKNQIEHMTKSQDERENKLLQSLRGAEEKQGELSFILPIRRKKFRPSIEKYTSYQYPYVLNIRTIMSLR